MSVFTSSVLDNFNRANETPLSGGGNWVHASGFSGGNGTQANPLNLVSNQASRVVGSASSLYTATSFGPAAEASVALAGFGSGSQVNLFLGVPSAASNVGINYRVDVTSGGVVSVHFIYENNVGAAVNGAASYTAALGDKLGLRAWPFVYAGVTGTYTEAWAWAVATGIWRRVGSRWINQVLGSGYAGFSTAGNVLFDDFAAGTISAPTYTLEEAVLGGLRDRLADRAFSALAFTPPASAGTGSSGRKSRVRIS